MSSRHSKISPACWVKSLDRSNSYCIKISGFPSQLLPIPRVRLIGHLLHRWNPNGFWGKIIWYNVRTMAKFQTQDREKTRICIQKLGFIAFTKLPAGSSSSPHVNSCFRDLRCTQNSPIPNLSTLVIDQDPHRIAVGWSKKGGAKLPPKKASTYF